jgi:hypothetical protein
VRLDVIHAQPLSGSHTPHRGDLIEDEVLSLSRRDPHFASAEPGEIRKAWMRAD